MNKQSFARQICSCAIFFRILHPNYEYRLSHPARYPRFHLQGDSHWHHRISTHGPRRNPLHPAHFEQRSLVWSYDWCWGGGERHHLCADCGIGHGLHHGAVAKSQVPVFLQISGSVILLLFGLFCFRSNPAKKMPHHTKNKGKGSLLNNGLTAFLVTFSNPLIIFLFMATFAQFAFVQPSRPFETCVGFTCIPLGALLWWYGLTWLVDKIGGRFNVTGIAIINKVIGSVVILFSVIILFGTVFNLYHLPSY